MLDCEVLLGGLASNPRTTYLGDDTTHRDRWQNCSFRIVSWHQPRSSSIFFRGHYTAEHQVFTNSSDSTEPIMRPNIKKDSGKEKQIGSWWIRLTHTAKKANRIGYRSSVLMDFSRGLTRYHSILCSDGDSSFQPRKHHSNRALWVFNWKIGGN